METLLKKLWSENGNQEIDAEDVFNAIRKSDLKISFADVLQKFDALVKNHVAEQTRCFAYVPYRSAAEKIIDEVRCGLQNTGYFDHRPTEDEIVATLRKHFCRMASCHMKLKLLTGDGAIARQLVERLHFEYFVVKPGLPVRVSYLLEDDPEAIMPSTLAIRKRMLADLAAKGFLRIEKNKAIPITPYPAWSVYARNKQ